MRVPKRIPPRTNPCRRAPPKIPNPLPKTAGAPVRTEQGCLFYDLRAKAAPAPLLASTLPPRLNNPTGRIISPEELAKMRQLRDKDPGRWTITALAGKFNISRSFVMKKVLRPKEHQMAEEELVERIDSLTLDEKRGWLMRYRIREHRRDLW